MSASYFPIRRGTAERLGLRRRSVVLRKEWFNAEDPDWVIGLGSIWSGGTSTLSEWRREREALWYR